MLYVFVNCHTGVWTQVILESDHSVVELRLNFSEDLCAILRYHQYLS